MPLFPSIRAMKERLGRSSSNTSLPTRPIERGRTPNEARLNLYPACSISNTTTVVKPSPGHIKLYSGQYYAACTLGGLLACGLTHTLVTPLDLVKVRRQVDSSLYPSNIRGLRHIYRHELGLRGIFTGWVPTFFGYSAQGSFKYGWYEVFKKTYSDLAGPENAYRYKTGMYLAASASAEFLADIALCPFEAVKVRMQAGIPSPYKGMTDGLQTITTAEGVVGGLYKGLYPLWGRQIPYTMTKFASFETIVELIYEKGLPGKKSDYGKAAQTGVSFTAGYLAGILCALVSHPADVMVSKLNAYRKPEEGFGEVVRRIYKDIGFLGLWNGLGVRIVMIGTLTGLQWMIYVSAFLGGFERSHADSGQDYFKIFMGFPTTGGPAPPSKKEVAQQ
ncbi:putative mitochondrial phosphate carrier protein [Thermochaetoides thermophila DSM 1495]|uniref:Putative mitochondrial phosphate carrier protein n=1 Tax=Chaetomium thermophilum (strain DSM 1495 / CBS 144.50 / IMI 039719) TaxID=759272 RepID=G0SDY1_CHATD|nr:putative mitochondrial phosphate carrier protein [Thermochaetoides thermophila DSM 1495]EGS18732.1 putative mitochondrial phosphate carrier protein [Thermochaetoides thermophila DSM 1495]